METNFKVGDFVYGFDYYDFKLVSGNIDKITGTCTDERYSLIKIGEKSLLAKYVFSDKKNCLKNMYEQICSSLRFHKMEFNESKTKIPQLEKMKKDLEFINHE